jgi:hypothetical protein
MSSDDDDNNELIADLYRQQGQILAGHLADFSDADMLVRPAESANHAAWQVGHLTVAFGSLINLAMPGTFRTEPQEFIDRHTAKGCRLNDGFAPKAELLAKFNEANERAIQWMRGLSDAGKRRSPEAIKSFAPTIAHLVHVLPMHVNMHIGQIQVIRRKLGKPILF